MIKPVAWARKEMVERAGCGVEGFLHLDGVDGEVPLYGQEAIDELLGLIREVMAADWRTNNNTLWPRLAAVAGEKGANARIEPGRCE